MNKGESVENALALLREADRSLRASDAAELRVRVAFRQRHLRRNRGLALLISAAAAMLLFSVVIWRDRSVPVRAQKEAAPDRSVITAVPKPEAPEHSLTPAAQKPKVRVARVSKPPVRHTRRPAEPLTAEFLPLPFAPPITEWDRAHVMRVQVPRQSLQRLGLPINEERLHDRVPAELLVGEDGLARGIRFFTTNSQ